MPSEISSYKTALVTGATSGLGKGLADFLEKKGIEVIRMGSKDYDLSHSAERENLLQLITEKKPDLVVNNAGFGLYGPCLSHSIEEQTKMIDVNVTALVEISLCAAKELIKEGKKGTILNISSAGAYFAYPTFNIYCASKAFVKQFSLALDGELQGQGVRVLCSCPGQIETDFRSRAAKGFPQQKNGQAMSIEKAVKEIWWQIEKEKPLHIFDWRVWLMVQISRIFPRRMVERILIEKLRSRYKKVS